MTHKHWCWIFILFTIYFLIDGNDVFTAMCLIVSVIYDCTQDIIEKLTATMANED